MKKTLLIHDTFLMKGGAERMNIEIAKILDADIATAIWSENCFKIQDFDYEADIFLLQKNFKKWMVGFLKMKMTFAFGKFLQKISGNNPLDKGGKKNLQNFSGGLKNSKKKEDSESNKEISAFESRKLASSLSDSHLKFAEWQFFVSRQNFLENYSTFFLSNEASSLVWQLPKNSKKIFYAHSISRHLFDLYDEYLAKVPFFAKIPYRIMAWILRKMYIAELWKFDIILTNSPANVKRLKEWCGVDAKLLFPPVDTNKFTTKNPLDKGGKKNLQNFSGGLKDSEKKEDSETSKEISAFESRKLASSLSDSHLKFAEWQLFFQNFLVQNPTFFISFARLTHTKGIDKIILAFRENPEHKILILFGQNDSQKDEFVRLAGLEPTNIQDEILQSEKFPNIFFVSISDNSQLPDLIREATATICMSKNEDFGMVAIESESCGVPVIAPNEWWYKETIVNGKTGILISENSAEKLSEILKNLDTKNLQNMQENCVQNASKFSLENFEKNLKNLIKNKKV